MVIKIATVATAAATIMVEESAAMAAELSKVWRTTCTCLIFSCDNSRRNSLMRD